MVRKLAKYLGYWEYTVRNLAILLGLSTLLDYLELSDTLVLSDEAIERLAKRVKERLELLGAE